MLRVEEASRERSPSAHSDQSHHSAPPEEDADSGAHTSVRENSREPTDQEEGQPEENDEPQLPSRSSDLREFNERNLQEHTLWQQNLQLCGVRTAAAAVDQA